MMKVFITKEDVRRWSGEEQNQFRYAAATKYTESYTHQVHSSQPTVDGFEGAFGEEMEVADKNAETFALAIPELFELCENALTGAFVIEFRQRTDSIRREYSTNVNPSFIDYDVKMKASQALSKEDGWPAHLLREEQIEKDLESAKSLFGAERDRKLAEIFFPLYRAQKATHQ